MKRLPKQFHHPRLLPVLMLVLVFSLCLSSLFGSFENSTFHLNHWHCRLHNRSQPQPAATLLLPTTSNLLHSKWESGPYHNWKLFAADFEEMKQQLKIFVYSDVSNKSSPFANIFLPIENPFHHPKLGNYFSEHIFKVALLRSSLVTLDPAKALFFFLPFSINNLRNDPRFHSEESISEFVAHYTTTISQRFSYWNASAGADHFYVCCHSVGRQAASRHPALHNNAIQLTCSSSYFQRFFVSHKDVGLPQVWPRPPQTALNPPHARHRLVYFAGRVQNSQVRRELVNLWGNDTEMDIINGSPSFPYEEGFKRSKYCLHVKGYEVNTARVSDSIHYGCIPVIISNYYDLPFATVLDWSKFSVVINQADIPFLKTTLLAITRKTYITMFQNLCRVRRHFEWHTTPKGYDSFYMTAYQLWLRRSIHRLSY
ncbi:catalytic, putative [Ricinus communis]|uniref:Catalytic, putative n=2 Tax=Ricinus communis TaxID=3988 RepID=B9RG47_RICCO|nr:catalytic, putative [Ricinus communis]